MPPRPARLCLPLGPGQTLTGTPAQFARLAGYLPAQTAQAPDPARLVRLQLWDGQVVLARVAELRALAAGLAARAPAPAHARYRPPAAAWSGAAPVPFAFPAQVNLVTQTLNARGTTGGLRRPDAGAAAPADPGDPGVSRSAQSYVAQVCRADLQSAWGWTPTGPLYTAPAGHILVAAVRIAVSHRLLLATDQLLAVRWVRSPTWDCYLPAALLNAWHLALATPLAFRRPPVPSATVQLPDPLR